MTKIKILFTRLTKQQTIRYLLSGGSAFATGITLLFILVQFFHVWYLLAAVGSFIISVYVSFIMQKFFTFNDYGKEKIRQQKALYLGIQIFNLSLNTLLMYIGVDVLNMHYIISQILVGGTIAVYSFFIYKHMIFCPDVSNKIAENNETVS